MGNMVFKEDLKNVLSAYKTQTDSIYVAQVSGKGLSTEDFTTAEKNKLASAATLDSNNKIPLANLPAEFNAVTTVANIAERNALTGNYDGRNVFVTDASADTTVTSGWAIYKYTASNTSWVKIAEGESLDLVLDWSNVQNIPNNILYKTDVKDNLTSTDTDKPLSANQGKVLAGQISTLDGAVVKTANIVDNLTSTNTDKPLSANQGKELAGQISTLDGEVVKTANIVDNVTSSDTNKPLSAKQGKVLKDAIDTINTTLDATSTLTQQEISDMMGEIFA